MAHLWLTAFPRRRQVLEAAAFRSLVFANSSTVSLNGDSPYSSIVRDYVIQPTGLTPTISIPSFLENVGVIASVTTDSVVFGLQEPLGTAATTGTVFIYHPEDNSISDSIGNRIRFNI